MTQTSLIEQEKTIAKTIKNQCTHICSRLDLQILGIIFCIMLEKDNGILQPFRHKLMH